jgi:hypothetical protein
MDVSNFIIEEQSFGGLHKLADNLRRDKAEAAEQDRRLQAGKAASTKFLTSYLDKDKFLTGDMHDPYRSIQIDELTQEGIELIKQGVDDTQLLMALSPKISKLSQDTQILKALQRQKREAVDKLKTNPAIDIDKLTSAFNENYFTTDEKGNKKLRDISELDPSKDYVSEIMNTQQIYTPAGVEKFLNKSQLNTTMANVVATDAKGGSRKARLEVSKPEFMQLNVDPQTGKVDETQKFVPKFEIAQDGDQPILGEFMTSQNVPVKEPIRLLEANVFNNLMRDADSAAYILGEAKQYAQKMGIPITDQRLELFSRALAYDLIKNSTAHKSTFKETQDVKEPPAPKTTVNIRTGGDKGREIPTIDLWTDWYGGLKKLKESGKAAVNQSIPNEQWKVIKQLLKDRHNEDFAVGDVITQAGNQEGTVLVYDRETKELLATLEESDLIVPANKPLGQKSVTEALKTKGGAKDQPKPAGGNKWEKHKRK